MITSPKIRNMTMPPAPKANTAMIPIARTANSRIRNVTIRRTSFHNRRCVFCGKGKSPCGLPCRTLLLGGLLAEAPVNGLLDALNGVDIERREPVVRRYHQADDAAHSGQLQIASPSDGLLGPFLLLHSIKPPEKYLGSSHKGRCIFRARRKSPCGLSLMVSSLTLQGFSDSRFQTFSHAPTWQSRHQDTRKTAPGVQ